MRITFVLPGPATRPVGGIRTVYRLAMSLAARGHRLTIVHPVAWLGTEQHLGRLHHLASWAKHAVLRDFTPRHWLPTPPDLRLRLVPHLSPRWLGTADAMVATGWRTMAPLAALPAAAGRRFAYLQHLEDWDGGRDAVLDAWRLPIRKIVASSWLLRELEAIGQSGQVVQYGIDHDLFFTENAPEQRPGPTIAFPAHTLAWKGTAVAVAALAELRATLPALRVEAFAPAPLHLPSWIHLSVDPSPAELRALYNRAQVFLAPSFSEGWDLPPCEAMACGTAVVASAIPAREEYAADGREALLVPAGDPDAAARAMRRLLADDALRHRLARAGLARVGKLTWERAAALFEGVVSRPDA